MPAKQIILNDEARQAMGRGVSIVGVAVATTLGPKGRNVVIQSPSGPIVTKDGVTVAKHIELEDPYEDLGAQLCKQVSSKTNDVAGDGTTTATVLANAFVTNGLKYISSGGNPISVKFGMEYAANKAVEIIEDLAKPIDEYIKGVVEKVGLRVTTVRDGQGTLWYLRNGEILKVGNQSQSG